MEFFYVFPAKPNVAKIILINLKWLTRSLQSSCSTEWGNILFMLWDFHFLYDFTEGSSISGTVFTNNTNFSGTLGHYNPIWSSESSLNRVEMSIFALKKIWKFWESWIFEKSGMKKYLLGFVKIQKFFMACYQVSYSSLTV